MTDALRWKYIIHVIKIYLLHANFSRLLKNNYKLYSEHNFHCSRTIFGRQIKEISLMNGIFSGKMFSYNKNEHYNN